MADEVKRCGKSVRVQGLRWPTYKPCPNNAKIERDGQWYCGKHDPVAREAKLAENYRKYAEKFDSESEQRERSRNCVSACSGVPTDQLRPGLLAELLAEKASVEP